MGDFDELPRPAGRALDPSANPFVARDGAVPPAFGGRDEILAAARVDLEQLRAGRTAARRALEGVRGVGKTALMAFVRRVAAKGGLLTAHIEADPGGDPTQAARHELVGLLDAIAPTRRARQAVRGLRSVKLGAAGVELAWDGPRDDSLVEALAIDVGRAASARGVGVLITLDEAQEAEPGLLKPLLRALHRCDQDGLPLSGWVAGLPGTVSHLIAQGQTYTERVALYEVGDLDQPAVARAIVRPFADHDVAVDEEVVTRVHTESGGYPFFVQCWGEALWNAATRPDRVSGADAEAATATARARADDLMRSRWARLPPAARRYASALAELGDGLQRTSAVAEALALTTKAASRPREELLRSVAAIAPSRGEVVFTLPGFAAWVRRHHPSADGD